VTTAGEADPGAGVAPTVTAPWPPLPDWGPRWLDTSLRWTPSAADIAAVEAKIAGLTLPLGSLKRYSRYYAGVIGTGPAKFIQGTLLPADGDEQPGIHILDADIVDVRRLSVEGPLPLQGACVVSFDSESRLPQYLRCTRPPNGMPYAVEIAVMEAKIDKRQLPLGSLDLYTRYYAAVGANGILGKLIPAGVNSRAGIHLTERRKLPGVPPEGCRTMYPSSAPVSVECAPPGAWTPSSGQIAELEGLLRRPENGIYAVQDYARHYAGVTKDGRRIIAGVLVIPHKWRGETAGIYIESEFEIPRLLDGGCSVVTVRYEPSSKEIEASCNGTT
jgi:hypothetical protein